MLIEGLLSAAAKVAVKASWNWARRREETERILRKVGVDFEPASARFDDVYRYTLVLFGLGKPRVITEIFAQRAVEQLLYQAYATDDRVTLRRDAREIIEWPTLKQLLEDYDYSPEPLLEDFLDCFNHTVDRVRTVVEMRPLCVNIR